MKYDAYVEFMSKYPYKEYLSKKTLDFLKAFFDEIKHKIKIVPGSFNISNYGFKCTCSDGNVLGFQSHDPDSIHSGVRDFTISIGGKDISVDISIFNGKAAIVYCDLYDSEGYHRLEIDRANQVHYDFYDLSSLAALKEHYKELPEVGFDFMFERMGLVADESINFVCEDAEKISILLDTIGDRELIRLKNKRKNK